MVPSTRYLIVGGGLTADGAARGIREHDADGPVLLVSAEADPPYARPPLSKQLWAGGDEAKIWCRTEELEGVHVSLGRRIAKLDLAAHRATDDRGEEISWEKLLLATGGRPRTLGAGDGIIYYRTLADYRGLRRRAHAGATAVVIGGGFIGSEIAAALSSVGCRVTMVLREPAIGSRLFPAGLAAFVTDYYRERGVEVLTGEKVAAADGGSVTTGAGRVLEADMVVAGLGIEPETALAEGAGLEVDNGIVVDELGRVGGNDDVYAAGDVASFPAVALGQRLRVEHEDHAKSHGRRVGENMAGAGRPYDHLPFFYSDLFDLGYEAVGQVDARLATRERWDEPNRKGIVAYVDEGDRPRGFLFWNTWNKVDAGRALIRAGAPLDEEFVV